MQFTRSTRSVAPSRIAQSSIGSCVVSRARCAERAPRSHPGPVAWSRRHTEMCRRWPPGPFGDWPSWTRWKRRGRARQHPLWELTTGIVCFTVDQTISCLTPTVGSIAHAQHWLLRTSELADPVRALVNLRRPYSNVLHYSHNTHIEVGALNKLPSSRFRCMGWRRGGMYHHGQYRGVLHDERSPDRNHRLLAACRATDRYNVSPI